MEKIYKKLIWPLYKTHKHALDALKEILSGNHSILDGLKVEENIKEELMKILKEKPMNVGLEEICYLMGTEYCELQLHGENQYNADAIESISFGSNNDVRNLSKKAIAKIQANRIPIYIGDKQIQIDERGKIKGI